MARHETNHPLTDPSLEPLRLLTEACPDGIVVVDGGGKILFLNPAAAALFPEPARAVPGAVFGYPVLAPEQARIRIGSRQVEMRVARSFWDGRPAYVACLRDVARSSGIDVKELSAALEEANARLERLATVDPLTGVLNRKGLEKALWTELARAEGPGTGLVAVLCWCKSLRKVVDRLGHAVGDVLLKAIAVRLQAVLRPSDPIARIDEDRFLVLLPETRLAEGVQVAEKLRHAVSSAPLARSPRPIRVDLRVAAVQAPPDTCSIEEILERAHHALRSGGWGLSGPRLQLAVPPRVPHLLDLAGAVRNGGFRAVSQPILDLESEQIVGHELLGRGPAGALEMPADFFRIALESNLLTTVDLSCLKACVDLSRRLPPGGKFHLNLFPSTILGTPSQRLIELLGPRNGVTFCIEISEQQFIGDPACLGEHVAAFKSSGIEVSIDDVGFGRSCLETLIMLEPDVVKIDRSYVDGAAGDLRKGRLLGRLVEVSRTLGAEIVAEGIESREDLALLRDYGVRYGQGWLWGKPGSSFIELEAAS